jgi:hypothetical protein
MGAWDMGSFDNDPALDWLIELLDIEDPAYIDQTLDRALVGEAKPEFYDCRDVIAAAEIVAILIGRPPKEIPDDAREWLTEHAFEPPPPLRAKARRAVARIKEFSELRDEWEQTTYFDAWLAAVNDLELRLAQA